MASWRRADRRTKTMGVGYVLPAAGLRPRNRGTFISACAQHLSRRLYVERRVSHPGKEQTRPSGNCCDARGSPTGRCPRMANLSAIGAPLLGMRLRCAIQYGRARTHVHCAAVHYSVRRAGPVWSCTRTKKNTAGPRNVPFGGRRRGAFVRRCPTDEGDRRASKADDPHPRLPSQHLGVA
jgi:hypothetical protein